ncbi:hypothetical protein MMC28_002325 [Mycoblastus sanguinarius]|nr:hypothetical protein [Mycoblastus sanguinarius]
MDGRGSGDLLAGPVGDALVGKPLKKKKSITRLFSSSSKKSFRSRPPSTEELHNPQTPPVPTPHWPLPPEAPILPESPRIVSMNSDWFKNEAMYGASERLLADEQSSGKAMAESDMQGLRRASSKAITKNRSEPASLESFLAMDDEGIARTASVVRIRQAEKPTIHHAPTFPIVPKRPKTGLRVTSAVATLPRGRGASVTVSKAKTSSDQHLLSRPSTAGGEYNPKSTGKRRPSANHAGHEETNSYLSNAKDLTASPQRPWQATYSNDEVRSSFRSALTTNSSRLETTSNERSSVLTKGTSITESTIDLHSRPASKVEGMTVDDAIDMYAAGFDDDDDVGPDESWETSMSEEERRRSMRIAEAINDSIGGLLPSPRPRTGESTTSTAIMSGDALRSRSPQPPPILPTTSMRDQYGFLKTNHHITTPEYDSWSNDYLPSQERRTKKWTSYMRDQGLSTYLPTQFPSRSTKIQRFIRKGIPPKWRGDAWFFYAGGLAYLERHQGLYPSLVSRSEAELPSNDRESIERDLHRTFPDNIHFKPNSTRSSGPHVAEPPLLTSLRRVLRAFALHSPKIGYCQSLNFLTGLLLLFLPEEKTFWMLHIITTVYLPGTHEISLEGANIDLWVLMVALKSTMPQIWAKVGAAGPAGDDLHGTARLPPISLCTTSWFMSLFIGTLPIESVLRVWDVLFYEGSKTLFRVALTIFKLGEQRIKDVSDPMELFQVVQGLPRGMLDAGALMTAVCRRGGVGSAWVEARRWERKEWYAGERARTTAVIEEAKEEEAGRERAKTAGGFDAVDMAVRGGEELGRKGSVWRRRKRKGSSTMQPTIPQLVSAQQDGISGVGRDLLSI